MIGKSYLTLNSTTWLISAAFGTLLAGVIVALDLSRNPDLLLYNLTQWAFTYDYGFSKRAFVGELISYWVAPDQLLLTLKLITLLISILVGIFFIIVVLRPYFCNRDIGLLAFAILAITHPATLQHFFYDQGRFDHLGWLLMVLGLFMIKRGGVHLSTAIVLTVSIIGILIHEVFLVLYLPLMLMYWFVRQPNIPLARLSQVVVTAVIVGVTIILVLNSTPPLAQETYVAALQSMHGDWISEKSVQVLYGGIAVESSRALNLLLSQRRLLQYLILGLFLFPTIIFIYGVFRRYVALARDRPEARELSLWLVVLAGLSPLAMFFVGIDFARWLSISITNMFIALALCAGESERFRDAIGNTFRTHPWLIWLALGSHFVSGPMGVAASAFPRIEPYIQLTYNALKQISN